MSGATACRHVKRSSRKPRMPPKKYAVGATPWSSNRWRRLIAASCIRLCVMIPMSKRTVWKWMGRTKRPLFCVPAVVDRRKIAVSCRTKPRKPSRFKLKSADTSVRAKETFPDIQPQGSVKDVQGVHFGELAVRLGWAAERVVKVIEFETIFNSIYRCRNRHQTFPAIVK